MREVFGDGPATVFGEGYGPKTQKGGDYADKAGLIVFDVRVGEWWLRPQDVADVASKLALPTVPTMGEFTLSEAVDRIAALDVASVTAIRHLMAEGIVGTPVVDLFNRKIDRIIAKVKARDFAPGRIAPAEDAA